jgi:transcriptional regulator GlxA family with amidase domain
MKLAYIIFDGITWLDFIGCYLPDLSWDICGFSEKNRDLFGLEVKPTAVRNSLSDYDAIIVPGGKGTRELRSDPDFIAWLKTAAGVPYKISICTGSLLLGAAGFLNNKTATTNFQEYETLRPYCREVLEHRIVDDNNTITAGAVTASIDLGLYLCRKWAGEEAAETIRKKIDYRG